MFCSDMPTSTARARPDFVTQFSVFTPNRLGRLHELVRLLGAKNVHVLGLMILDTTDCAVIRFVADDPEVARELLTAADFPFSQNSIVVVEVNSSELARLMAALLEAELNINYLYSFIPHPQGRARMALSMEDNELAEQALAKQSFKVLRQADLSR